MHRGDLITSLCGPKYLEILLMLAVVISEVLEMDRTYSHLDEPLEDVALLC